jgi:UDP-N-acetylglucosamine--N-acetylmuramyl-(pentapeptide) pyrophosphoryl-undecaprenol N-acetylglucosamine transferase
MGGFTSTAPVVAGRFRGISTFIHESNAVPGKANRYTARFVRAVLLGFKECASFFPKAQTEVTGTPIRSDLQRIDRAEALQKLGLVPGVPTLLVMGGSQGASGINRALIKAMPALQGIPLQVIHLTGVRDARLVEDNYQRENIRAHVAAFHHQMEEVYSAADLAITRSGASSLAELALFGLPALLVPYPYAADDHQTRNAEIFVRQNAALIVKESELSGDVLARKVRDLLGDAAKLRAMSASAADLAPKDAAASIVETMERYNQPHDAVAA